MNEGHIKFNCDWIKSNLDFDITHINKWRTRLYDLKLIWAYDNNIGYGNISVRLNNGFIITGSGTGKISLLNKEHYTYVVEYDFEKNHLKCEGPIKASSESLSHAAVYERNPKINAVIHVHNIKLWTSLINKVPTTSKKAEYGTPELAYEIMKIKAKENIIIMAGHKEGIITFGNDLDEAGNILLKYYKNIK